MREQIQLVNHHYDYKSEEVSVENFLLNSVWPFYSGEDSLQKSTAAQNLQKDRYHQPGAMRNVDQYEAERVNNEESGEAVNKVSGNGGLVNSWHLEQPSNYPDA